MFREVQATDRSLAVAAELQDSADNASTLPWSNFGPPRDSGGHITSWSLAEMNRLRSPAAAKFQHAGYNPPSLFDGLLFDGRRKAKSI